MNVKEKLPDAGAPDPGSQRFSPFTPPQHGTSNTKY